MDFVNAKTRVSYRNIDTLIRELRYVSSETFLRGLNLNEYQQEALNALLIFFPRNTSGSPSNQNEFGQSLSEGWYAETVVQGASVGFKVAHALASNSRAMTILKSLDKGSRSHDFVPEENLHVLLRKASGDGKGLNWRTLKAGESYFRPAHAGFQYTSKTDAFIRAHILPQLKTEIRNKIASRMERVK